MSETDRSDWKSNVSRLDEQTGADDYWLEMTPSERVALTWELSKESWQLAQQDHDDEPGLPRSVARVVRGGR